MIKKRFTLSLIALIGSALLLVVASFAWFAVSDIVNVSSNTIQVQDIDVTATLYESDDATYTSNTEILNLSFENDVPGSKKYYMVEVTNNNDFSVDVQIYMSGITDTYTDIGGDTSNYTNDQSLMDVVQLYAYNNINADIINDTLTNLIYADVNVVTHESVSIPASGTALFYFSLEILGTAGNDYQNLQLDINHLFVSSIQE